MSSSNFRMSSLNLRCVTTQRAEIECVLMREEHVVHLPEPSLSARRFSSFRCLLRVRVYLHERKVSEHESHLVRQHALNALNGLEREPAVRALIITVLDQSDYGVNRASSVILRAYGWYQGSCCNLHYGLRDMTMKELPATTLPLSLPPYRVAGGYLGCPVAFRKRNLIEHVIDGKAGMNHQANEGARVGDRDRTQVKDHSESKPG